IDGHGPIAGINTSFRGGWKKWWKDNTPPSRSRSLQPKWPALKMTNGAERALPMSTKGFQTPSLRRRAQGNHGASGLVPPYGASAFRNLRSGLPSGYGVGEKISARPNISVLRQNRPRSSVRQQDFSARSLTSHHHVSCKQCVCAETRIVAAVAPAVTAA